MFKFKNLFLGMCLIVLASFIAGCGENNKESSTNKSDGGSSQEMQIAFQGSEETAVYKGLEKFSELIEDKTDGEIMGTLYPNGQLGNLREQTESVQSGTVHMGQSDMQTMSSFVDSVAIFNLPYLLPTEWDEYYDIATNDELFDIVQNQMHENGFHLLGFPGLGYKAITTNKKPIHSLDDLKGTKIRIVPSDILTKQYEVWGAEPVPVDYQELYTSLQTGVVDAQENPFESTYTMGFHEVQDYMTITKHAQQIQNIVVNKDWYDGLNSDLQDALDEAGQEAMEYQREVAKDEQEEFKEKIIDEGDVEVNELSEEEMKEFKEASESLYEDFAESKHQKDLLDAIEKLKDE